LLDEYFHYYVKTQILNAQYFFLSCFSVNSGNPAGDGGDPLAAAIAAGTGGNIGGEAGGSEQATSISDITGKIRFLYVFKCFYF